MVMVVSFCVLAGRAVVFFVISCEYSFADPIVRKNDNKTILNKFVFKGFNAIFVKIWLVY